MQFVMLSWVGQGTCITWGCRCPHGPWEGALWECLGIEKHCKAQDFVQKTGVPILTIYTPYNVCLMQGAVFWAS